MKLVTLSYTSERVSRLSTRPKGLGPGSPTSGRLPALAGAGRPIAPLDPLSRSGPGHVTVEPTHSSAGLFSMRQYLDFMRHVRQRGDRKSDRTGTGTLSVFGYQMR